MQVAKGPYKCVPRQLRMTCEPRSSARRLVLPVSSAKRAPHETLLIAALETSVRMATGQPQVACKATARGIPRGALTTDLQLTSAHWLVALAKSSSQRAAQAHSEASAAATHAFSGSALGA